MNPALQRALAELVGTFVLVAVGCGAIVVDAHTGGAVTHLGVSLAFGLVVMVVIYALGDVSGAHINPAVSVGFWVAGLLPRDELLRFLAAQCAGALLAALMLRWASCSGLAPRRPLRPRWAWTSSSLTCSLQCCGWTIAGCPS